MIDIQPDEVDQLVDTLNNLPLEAPQRTLLDAILWVVAEIKEQTEEDEGLAYAAEFTHAFKKAQADLVLEYAASTHDTGEHMITRSMTTPASIIRTPPTPPGPDDDN